MTDILTLNPEQLNQHLNELVADLTAENTDATLAEFQRVVEEGSREQQLALLPTIDPLCVAAAGIAKTGLAGLDYRKKFFALLKASAPLLNTLSIDDFEIVKDEDKLTVRGPVLDYFKTVPDRTDLRGENAFPGYTVDVRTGPTLGGLYVPHFEVTDIISGITYRHPYDGSALTTVFERHDA